MQSFETKSSRQKSFGTETRPETFETKTETLKNGSRDMSRDRNQVSRLHHYKLKPTWSRHNKPKRMTQRNVSQSTVGIVVSVYSMPGSDIGSSLKGSLVWKSQVWKSLSATVSVHWKLFRWELLDKSLLLAQANICLSKFIDAGW